MNGHPFRDETPLRGALWAICWLAWAAGTAGAQTSQSLPAAIEARLGFDAPIVTAAPAPIGEALATFYRARDFQPLWLTHEDRGRARDALLGALEGAHADGLRGSDYVEEIATLDATASTPAGLAELEIALSVAYLRLAEDLARGAVDPTTLPGEWSNEREPFDALAALRRAAAAPPASALDALRPPHRQYRALRAVLAELRRTPDWGRVSVGMELEAGDRDPRVSAVRGRLRKSGDLPSPETNLTDAELFDADLEAGVRRFQARHGLRVDGVVGRATIEALNVSVAERIRQVEANLERWRWLPRDLGTRYLVVNVPGFSVTVETPSGVISRHRAVVGRTDRETPTFSSAIESFALAPYWNVPPTLARRDILPKIRSSRGYLAQQRIRILDARSGAAVDPASIDWGSISDADFLARYRLRQEPGPLNALGDVKLVFPNPYTVFLHDTATPARFEDNPRALSSGCIRVERPLEILAWLLDGDPEWPNSRIHEIIEDGEEQHGRLKERVPIHVLYLTAVVEDDGRPGFRSDLYGLDAALVRALGGASRISGGTPGITFTSCN